LLAAGAGYFVLANEFPNNLGGPAHWIGKKVLDEIKCKTCVKATEMISNPFYRVELWNDL